jgi:2-oxo-3-hexenedioate decarboxylase
LDAKRVAAELLRAQAECKSIAPFSSRDPAFDIAAAYDVARLQLDARIARGERPAGRKIGFTNRGIWAQYGVNTPIWAYMYDTTVRMLDGNSGEVPLAKLVSPRIEPEIILKLVHAPASGMSEAGLLQCIEWIAHGYEIVHCHFPGWKFAAADAIADFCLHGALVIGKPLSVTGEGDLAGKLAGFSIALLRNGEVQDNGTGANVLGSPLRALAYLVDAVAALPQFAPLAAGEIITTGTLTAALPVQPGETWSTRLDGIALPGLTVNFV